MPKPLTLLSHLEGTRLDFSPGSGEIRSKLLWELRRVSFATAEQVIRFHELLCYLRAGPDDGVMLAEVETLLNGFDRRSDLRQHRGRLVDTGIAGTDIHYPFFWPTAGWLARRWPSCLAIDWELIDDDRPFMTALPLLVTPVEAAWLRVTKPSLREALARLAGKTMTDAVFLVRQVQSMPGDDFTREAFYDGLSPPLILRSGVGTPSRTRAYVAPSRIHFPGTEAPTRRPDLWLEIERPPHSVRSVSPRDGERLIDLAREAMVTRARDLDAFAYGNPRDVRLIEDGEGLSWAMIGLLPERRPPIRTAYGFLTFRNGVPIGYVQADTLWRCVDLAFNTFSTFRSRDSALLLGRTMAMLRSQFDATSFTLEPYQLGDGNDEGIESGAWWFYYKLGFRPRQPLIRGLAKAELKRIDRNPRHRSSPATLRRLAADYLYLDRPGARAPRWPQLASIGTRVAGLRPALGENGSFDRSPLSQELTQAWSRATPPGRTALIAWAPLVALLPGLEYWSRDHRSALIDVILAKGGRRETDYLRLFDRHPQLGDSLRQVTRA